MLSWQSSFPNSRDKLPGIGSHCWPTINHPTVKQQPTVRFVVDTFTHPLFFRRPEVDKHSVAVQRSDVVVLDVLDGSLVTGKIVDGLLR